MSSSTSLSRTRSLQKPTSGSNGSTRGNAPAARNDARTTSPSRLPVKPTMTTRSMASNASAAPSTTTARRTASSMITGRPTSGIYSKGTSARADNAGNTTAKASRPLGRAASTRQASSTSTTAGSIPPPTRSASTTVSRPRSSGGPPPAASNRPIGHSRSKSTVTSLTAATTLRPATQSRISQTSSTSSGRTSPAASTITTASSKAPTRQTRSQTHSRTKSQSNPSSTSASAAPSQQPTARPAFNTHQQHYSPAKSLAPKPLTSTFLAPPSPSKLPANVAISAETSRLQTELLQLSLLHRDAAAVDAEWRSSAREKLGARFARLVADHDALVRLERHGVEARNITALVRWGKSKSKSRSGRSGLGLEEKLQILDEVLNGVWQLGEPGGRYHRVVASFEAWAERMASIVAAQRSGDVDGLIAGGEVQFLGDLDRSWARDCQSLLRKLEGWRAALRDLDLDPNNDDDDGGNNGVRDDGSGLARMVRGSRALVDDMLAELALMGQIERDAARTENDWISRMNKAIEDEDDDTPAARAYVPLWKMAV
ncbi:uncharacterized protein F4812DRAFT_441171 [Daldinia caldariorum]|uniref:uncharacterized protein n=1 Tax=Daldinia caldariorum TaxID=326644 RepID=UPI00200767DF|nr:uncharacterized protein F4812DRAFT_441171 [Daldinia caldariorum]KAI1464968.1 hypothetical protein F4812DRAFT_441171 [Daldinia caldariorum]